MERALVIGATGFLGRRITHALVHSEIAVEAMRRWNSDTDELDELGVQTVVADLLDRNSLIETLTGFNYVFMAAAPDPAAGGWHYIRDSVLSIRHLLDVAREVDVERVVVTSCATTVSRPAKGSMATEADVYLPGSAENQIVEAQYAVEQECFREAADGMELVIVNPGICIGDGAKIPSRKLLSHVQDGARINLVDVDDVARAHIEAAREPSYGERFLLGGENTTIGELAERLEKLGGAKRRLGRYEVQSVDSADKLRHLPLYEQGCWLDSGRAERRLGFRPRSL